MSLGIGFRDMQITCLCFISGLQVCQAGVQLELDWCQRCRALVEDKIRLPEKMGEKGGNRVNPIAPSDYCKPQRMSPVRRTQEMRGLESAIVEWQLN